MNDKDFRQLTASEISLLKAQGNSASDWSAIKVCNPFIPELVCNNRFSGDVKIGQLAKSCFTDNGLSLEEGLYNSTFSNVELGAHVAIHNVSMLANYRVGDGCMLFNISQMVSSAPTSSWIQPMNENGGRSILPSRDMNVADAYLWARLRGHTQLMSRFERFSRQQLDDDNGFCTVGAHAVVRNTVEIHNVTILSSSESPSRIIDNILLSDGIVGYGCSIMYGCMVSKFLLGENVHLEYGLRLNDTVVGDNSTIARCEVANSMIFPAHEQHHNSSFLIASLLQGQSNLASGATIGSNHNGRTADNELSAGRGFWPGLCVSLKHSSRFASYCLLSKGDYPYELNVMLPFSLINNNVSKNQLEIMPAYWWLYNMYALKRNESKFASRDKRVVKAQHIEFDPFAPDTAEEILIGRNLIKIWTERAYMNNDGNENLVVTADGMENSRRKTVILKAGAAYRAYEEMLIYYAVKTLCDLYGEEMPPLTLADNKRCMQWFNVGGQLVRHDDLKQLIDDVESGVLNSWHDVNGRLDQLWEQYPYHKARHAYQMLCELSEKKVLSEADWAKYCSQYRSICYHVADQVRVSRQKDNDNPYRALTFWDENERNAVMQ